MGSFKVVDVNKIRNMTNRDRRVYCWIRQQRFILAVHNHIYHELNDSILEDLQFDYLVCRLEVVETRYWRIADAVTKEGYLSPTSYDESLLDDYIEARALSMLSNWERGGRPFNEFVPYMTSGITNIQMYRDALRQIVRYPID